MVRADMFLRCPPLRQHQTTKLYVQFTLLKVLLLSTLIVANTDGPTHLFASQLYKLTDC